jgi:hypothetical protein
MSDVEMIPAEVLRDGANLAYMERRAGDRLSLEPDEFYRAEKNGVVRRRPKMKVKAIMGNLQIGARVFGPGEEGEVEPKDENIALDRYVHRQFDIVDAAGATLPPRVPDRSMLVKSVVKRPFEHRRFPRGMAEGQEVEMLPDEARPLAWQDFLTPIGWDPGMQPMALFRRIEAGVLNRRADVLPESQALDLESRGGGVVVRQGPVRLLAERDVVAGPGLAPLRKGDVALFEAATALRLALAGDARGVGDDVPVTPAATPPAKKVRT